ncbi:hypothetical protein [Phaffia rhodozyma]|uniref:Uncharacterized protein n=1 Tax=Phaffia rhodozyma TaxID=264483 RepID=A0A0F7STM7_PHARH|nr:hypothetical protein [Phaffia rhodozyma]
MSSTNYTTTPGPDRPIETSDSTKTSSGGETNYGDRNVYGSAGQGIQHQPHNSGLGQGAGYSTGSTAGYSTGSTTGYSTGSTVGSTTGHHTHEHHATGVPREANTSLTGGVSDQHTHHYHAGSAGTGLGAGAAAGSLGSGVGSDTYRSEQKHVPYQNATGHGTEGAQYASGQATGPEITAGHAHTGSEAPERTAYGRGSGLPLAESGAGKDNTGAGYGHRVNDAIHDDNSIDRRTQNTNDLIDSKTKSVPSMNTHDNVTGSGTSSAGPTGATGTTGAVAGAHHGEAGGLHKTSATDTTDHKPTLMEKIKNII